MGGHSGSGAASGAAGGPRILVTAQPFGFGPAAAAAILADELACLGARLGYLGAEHTLDLQHMPPYAAVHDVTGLAEGERLALLRQLACEYDLLLTAMDFPMAALGCRAGLRVAVYDALTWYWPCIPAVVREPSVLYIAQDFFGVRERVAAERELARRAVVVPPFIAPGPRWRAGGRDVLVNLGGLQNPFWQPRDTAAYARLVVAAVRAGTSAERRVVVATGRRTARDLADVGGGVGGGIVVGTYGRAEVLRMMSESACAFMTPGLGNVYDAAATGVPTVWLPPANNTQALQVELLSAHGCCDERVDWADLGRRVDHRGAEGEVMGAVRAVVREVGGDVGMRGRLVGRVRDAVRAVGGAGGRAQGLTARFGGGGAGCAAAAVVGWAMR
ncbi:hypothetical protein ACIO13_17060 [Streptomyces sp. NPDC087425]|uniref:hypothetical protein n=1 Tax=Streptomyces sp. NPDC087425 TaxID=3365787 RepID=UPI0037F94A87